MKTFTLQNCISIKSLSEECHDCFEEPVKTPNNKNCITYFAFDEADCDINLRVDYGNMSNMQ